MARWKCNACGGTYNDLNADGSAYHHSCGPLPPDAQLREAERPNKRDERVVMRGRRPTGEIVSEGAGVTALDGQADPEPKWITALKATAE